MEKLSAFLKRFGGPILVLLYLASPFFLSDYLTYLLLITSIMVILSQGLNVLIGFTGLISFGQPGFMAFAAYFSAVVSTQIPGIPFPVLLIGTAAVTALFGLLIGFPCLRLSGFYLALATFGFSSAIFELINFFKSLTGGYVGMSVPAPTIGSFRLIGTDRVFWLTAVCMVLVVLVVRNLGRTRTGRAWNAIRDDQIAASSMGVNLRREKLKAFSFAAFLAGIAGALYSYTIRYLETSYFELMGLSLFLILVVGGIGRIYGPILGALFITTLPQMIGGVFNQHMSLVFGTVLVLFILLAPSGFYGLIDRVRGRGPSGPNARQVVFPAAAQAAESSQEADS